jgi:hypothetical protein
MYHALIELLKEATDLLTAYQFPNDSERPAGIVGLPFYRSRVLWAAETGLLILSVRN